MLLLQARSIKAYPKEASDITKGRDSLVVTDKKVGKSFISVWKRPKGADKKRYGFVSYSNLKDSAFRAVKKGLKF